MGEVPLKFLHLVFKNKNIFCLTSIYVVVSTQLNKDLVLQTIKSVKSKRILCHNLIIDTIGMQQVISLSTLKDAFVSHSRVVF